MGWQPGGPKIGSGRWPCWRGPRGQTIEPAGCPPMMDPRATAVPAERPFGGFCMRVSRSSSCIATVVVVLAAPSIYGQQKALPGKSAVAPAAPRVSDNRLTRLTDPKPLLADYPEFVEPVHETVRFEAPL